MGSTTCSKILLHNIGKHPIVTSPLAFQARDTADITMIKLPFGASTVDTHTTHGVGIPVSPTMLNNTFRGITPHAARAKRHADQAGATTSSVSALADLPLRLDGMFHFPPSTKANRVIKQLGPHTGPQQIPTTYPTDIENSGAHLADATQSGVRGDPGNTTVRSTISVSARLGSVPPLLSDSDLDNSPVGSMSSVFARPGCVPPLPTDDTLNHNLVDSISPISAWLGYVPPPAY